MIVFDISSADSFAKAKTWVKELQRQGNPNMIMALTGNKADLADQRQVRRVAGVDSRSVRAWQPACRGVLHDHCNVAL